MVGEIRRALADRNPVPFLMLASTLLAAFGAFTDGGSRRRRRTACRRVLARMARTDPRVFIRAKRIELSGVGLYYGYGGPQVRDLAAHFGVTSPSQKSEVLLRAGGFESRVAHGLALGSPEYLVGTRRRDIIESRDRYRVIVAEAESGPREDR